MTAKFFAITLLLLGLCHDQALAHDYYVAADAADDGDGSLRSPWNRVGEAIQNLKPGDTLYLRGGVYYESDIELQVQGRHGAKIVIASYPGEVAEIVAGQDLPTADDKGQWELVDAKKGIYRSLRKLDLEPAGWNLDADELLWKYNSYRDFAASQNSGRYCGPGVATKNGQLFVRLQLHTHDADLVAEADRQSMLAGLDPNQTRIRLIEGESLMTLSDSSFVELRNLRLHGGLTSCIQLDGATNNISIRDCEIRFNLYGLIVGQGCSDVDVSGCRIRNGFPEWGRWGDVKIGSPPPMECYNACAIAIDGASDVRVVGNRFEKCFQSVSVVAKNFLIADNIFLRPHEGILMSPGSSGEIAGNVIWHAMESFSLVGQEDTRRIGQVFIHHNIVDLSEQRVVERRGNFGLFEREVSAGWDSFGDHDCNESCEASQFMIYNNTFIGGADSGNVGWNSAGTPLRSEYPKHKEYNNIYVSLGQVDLTPQTKDAAGNVTWSVDESQRNQEPDGLVLDPGIKLQATDMEVTRFGELNLEAIRALYRPAASQCLTPGKSYEGLEWPGVANVNYRGAVP